MALVDAGVIPDLKQLWYQSIAWTRRLGVEVWCEPISCRNARSPTKPLGQGLELVNPVDLLEEKAGFSGSFVYFSRRGEKLLPGPALGGADRGWRHARIGKYASYCNRAVGSRCLAAVPMLYLDIRSRQVARRERLW